MRYNNQLSEVLQKWHRNNGGDKIKKKKLADLNRIMEQIPHLWWVQKCYYLVYNYYLVGTQTY